MASCHQFVHPRCWGARGPAQRCPPWGELVALGTSAGRIQKWDGRLNITFQSCLNCLRLKNWPHGLCSSPEVSDTSSAVWSCRGGGQVATISLQQAVFALQIRVAVFCYLILKLSFNRHSWIEANPYTSQVGPLFLFLQVYGAGRSSLVRAAINSEQFVTVNSSRTLPHQYGSPTMGFTSQACLLSACPTTTVLNTPVVLGWLPAFAQGHC